MDRAPGENELWPDDMTCGRTGDGEGNLSLSCDGISSFFCLMPVTSSMVFHFERMGKASLPCMMGVPNIWIDTLCGWSLSSE